MCVGGGVRYAPPPKKKGFHFFLFLSKTYVLDPSRSFDMHIDKMKKKKKIRCPHFIRFFYAFPGAKGSILRKLDNGREL